jgi:hypothetical protein
MDPAQLATLMQVGFNKALNHNKSTQSKQRHTIKTTQSLQRNQKGSSNTEIRFKFVCMLLVLCSIAKFALRTGKV